MIFSRKTEYDKEVDAKNRIDSMLSTIDVILNVLGDKNAEIKRVLLSFGETIKYFVPVAGSSKLDNKIQSSLDDLLLTANKAIKDNDLDNKKITNLCDELRMQIARRKQLRKEF